mgnify:CR=1 FL=1
MSNSFDKLKIVKYIDRNVLSFFYDTTTKNVLLIALVLYCVFFVRHVPKNIIRLTNRVDVRILIAVIIVYISRRHIDLGILLVMAFYFTLREARSIAVVNNGELQVKDAEDKAIVEEAPVILEEEETTLPFQQAKNPNDKRHPAHIREDMAVFDEENMGTCVAVSDRDMCAGGLFSPAGYIANDFNNLADF